MSRNLTEDFLRLKRMVGGNRELTGYEDTFGMPMEEQAHITRPNPWNTRILSELEFALRLREDDLYDSVIARALEELLQAMDADGVLSNGVCEQAERILLPLRDEAKSYHLILAAHSHIDMNWMWGYPETVAATLATFRTMLTLMNEYADFCFSQSQAAVYEIVEKYDPEMMMEIKRRIEEGRWECTASAWVEADHNMPGTESMLRHIEYTRKYLSEKWGVRNFEIDFSPDTFGHTLFLPEIDSYSGVKYLYHCRGLKEDVVLYRYRSPSGQELLAYREPFWYNAAVTPRLGTAVPVLSRRCGGLKTGLGVYGVGDHGGGPTRRDIEFARQMMYWPIFPEIRFGTLLEYFHEAESVREKVPLITHEANFFSTGCYTTQSRIKQGNRRLEAQLCDAEGISASALGWTAFHPNTGGMTEAWQNVLFTHFHDILTGSCVQDSREHAMGLYQQSAAMAQSQMSQAMQAICRCVDTSSFAEKAADAGSQSEGAGAGYHVESFGGFPCPERGSGITRVYQLFNPTAVLREDTVEITAWDWIGDLKRASATDECGNEIPLQLVDQRLQKYWDHQYFRFLVRVRIPALGYTTVVLREREMNAYPLYFQENVRVAPVYDDLVLDSGKLRAVLDRQSGRVQSLKIDGKELLGGSAGFSLALTEEKTSNAWKIGRYIKRIPVDECRELEMVESGPVRQRVLARYAVASSTIEVTYTLDTGSDVLRLDVKTDWNEIGGVTVPVLLYEAPLSYCPAHFRYDVAAGSVCRGVINNDVPALGYGLAAAEGGPGLLLLNDCKYGYRGEEEALVLTLLNSSTRPDPYPERGIHTFAIGLSGCADLPDTAEMKAICFNHPVQYQSNSIHPGTLPAKNQMFSLNAEGVVISSVREEEGGLLIRLYEVNGKESGGVLHFDLPLAVAEADNGYARRKCGTAVLKGNSVEFTVPSYQLMGIRVRFS